MDIKDNTVSRSKDNGDKASISSIKSTRKSKSHASSNGLKSEKVLDIESEDISLSQLELMANKKKLNKPDEISIVSKKAASTGDLRLHEPQRISLKKSSSSTSSSSTSSSSSDNTKQKLRNERAIQKENRNDAIRKEKSELLFKFNKLNVKGKWSSLRLDMDSSLDSIKNEYERVRNEIQTERSVAFFKRMLLLGVQGVEMLNTRFDPLGVDLDGWSEAMGYSMENQEYDEVMAELYEKYKGRGQMSPEMKLIFMIISSATMFTISKKITKMDSSNAFASLIGSFVGKQPQMPQQQFQQQQFQQQNYQQQMPQQFQQQMYQQQNYIPNPADLMASKRDIITETTEDVRPSKMKDPEIFQDDIDLDNILKTMKERKREKERQEVTETSDDILKSIPMTQKRGRGRPKKNNNSLRMM